MNRLLNILLLRFLRRYQDGIKALFVDFGVLFLAAPTAKKQNNLRKKPRNMAQPTVRKSSAKNISTVNPDDAILEAVLAGVLTTESATVATVASVIILNVVGVAVIVVATNNVD